MGNTPTHHQPTSPECREFLKVCSTRNIEACQKILKTSLNHLHARGEQHRTPILLCVALGSLPVVYDSASRTQFLGYLLSRGALVSDQDEKGWTPLHHCLAVGDLDSVRLLIENGADPDATNNQGIRAIEFLERDYIVPGKTPYIKEQNLHELIQSLTVKNKNTSSTRQINTNTSNSQANSSRSQKAQVHVPKVQNNTATGFDDDDSFNNEEDDFDYYDQDDTIFEPTSPGNKEHGTDADSTTSPGSTLWKMEYCSLRCPDIITQGNVLNVEFTRGSDHCTTSFVQLYYIDKKPWMLRSRLGSFQSFPKHLQSGTFQFQTKRLSANGKFRLLYHGQDKKVLCASNMFRIQDPGVSGKSLVAAALATNESFKNNNLIDEDEFSTHLLEQDRSWALPPSSKFLSEYQQNILQLTKDESLWIKALKDPPPVEYSFNLIMSKMDIAIAMEDDKKLIPIRFRLCPCWLDETEFWRVYFWKLAQLRLLYQDKEKDEKNQIPINLG